MTHWAIHFVLYLPFCCYTHLANFIYINDVGLSLVLG